MNKISCFLQTLSLIIAVCFISACTSEKIVSENNTPAKNSEEKFINADNKVLSLCDLGNNPAEFDGKIVRIKTRILFGTENTVISNENCLHNAVSTFKDEEAFAPIDKVRKELIKKNESFFQADVEIEGKFINKPFTACCTRTPFQFEITKTFEVQPIKLK